MKIRHVVMMIVLLAAMTGCSEAPDAGGQLGPRVGGRSVYVVNYPLAYFAQRIGGEHVDVTFPAPDDVDPAFWKPDEATVRAYQDADLILLNGADYAKWTKTHTLPESRTVNTTTAVRDQYITIEHAHTHSHGEGGEHTHAGADFNTWVDPTIAIRQASAIADALKRMQPDHAAAFDTSLTALRTDLLQLSEAFVVVTEEAIRKSPLVASHPVYNYIARRYGWNLLSVVWEPETMPSDEQWASLEKLLNEHPAKHMLWEDEPIEPIRERLTVMGIKVVVFRPCGNRPPSGDYMTEMRANVERLRGVFE